MVMNAHSGKDIDSFEQWLGQSKVPVLAAFLSKDCRQCATATDTLQMLATAYRDRLAVVRIELKDSPALMRHFRVLSVPALFLFKGGEVLYEFTGQPSWRELEAVLDRAMRNRGPASNRPALKSQTGTETVTSRPTPQTLDTGDITGLQPSDGRVVVWPYSLKTENHQERN